MRGKRYHWDWFRMLNSTALFLAFVVIVLGAYTRLTDSGLGCPDWPGCYGSWTVPDIHTLDATSALILSKSTVQAWTEMIHRYAAGTLGLFILILMIGSFVRKKNRILASFLLIMVLFQAYLGQATVTLKLHPLVVMGHLLGGIFILSLLYWMRLNQATLPFIPPDFRREDKIKWLARLGLPLLFVQIALGGWTSANYAGLVCPSFPACTQQGNPAGSSFNEAFAIPGFEQPLGFLDKTYEARVTIQMTHRYGALFIGLWLLYLSMLLMQYAYGSMKVCGFFMGFFLLNQVILGAVNAIFALPLAGALLHHAMAVLLFMSLLFTAQRLKGR